MSYTKRQFIYEAFAEIGMAEYVFDLEVEQLQSARRRLDSMLAEWNGGGIRIGYPLPDSPEDSALDDTTGVPDSANEAIITNLAIRLAPSFGKTVNPSTKASAKSSFAVLMSRAAMPQEMQLPSGMPAGAGNKPQHTGSVFMPEPSDALAVGPDSPLILE